MTDSTGAIGMARLSFALAQGPTAEDRAIQAGIDAAMRGVIASAGYNPVLRDGGPTRFEPKPGNGWVAETPLASPMPKGSFVEGVIGGMIDHALGPAVPPKTGEG